MSYDRTATARLALDAYAAALEKATVGVLFHDLNERDVALEAMEAALAAVEPIIIAERPSSGSRPPMDFDHSPQAWMLRLALAFAFAILLAAVIG